MKLDRRLWVMAVGLCTLWLGFSIMATGLLAGETVTITGTVYEDQWDENDNPIAVVIDANDGEEYKISSEGKGRELLKLDNQELKATGVVVEDGEGQKTIKVTEYEIVE